MQPSVWRARGLASRLTYLSNVDAIIRIARGREPARMQQRRGAALIAEAIYGSSFASAA